MGMEQYRIETHPETKEKSIIQGDKYRISILTEALVRFEYSADGVFEDRATQKVLNRDFETPDYHVSRDKNGLHIFTGAMEIHYDGLEFTPGGLMVRVAGYMAYFTELDKSAQDTIIYRTTHFRDGETA